MEDCSAMGIDPPMSASDIPAVREKVMAKLKHWKEDQDAQTEKVSCLLSPAPQQITNTHVKNIAKAKAEVERLEAEESSSVPGTPTTSAPAHANGETKATASVDEGGSVANEVELIKSAAADVVADLKGASLEDKE